ncbi:MAG: hypothetical protein IJP92_08955 [Lachnospiraceae bacterium]|nr:hypothetical protein [Lachnospiraceae bacterium]
MFFQTLNLYIDPSAITYIIQAVAGVVVALGAILTIFRHKIFKRFKKDGGEGETGQEIVFKENASQPAAEEDDHKADVV